MTNHNEQLSMLENEDNEIDKTVTVLGMTFKNDYERREYFTEELRKKLPDLKNVEGFPVGDDEDILAMSDPPYYTACPNPWLCEVIDRWNEKKEEKRYKHKKPYTIDVKEGKNDPVYLAHSYHTKVPYKAIMRYILHYTEPGDVVFDGFSGSGMTGVAGQLCASMNEVENLGYTVDQEGNVYQKIDNELEKFSKIGSRNVVMSELSTAATFISYNYNASAKVQPLGEIIHQELSDLSEKYSYLYKTLVNKDKKLISNLVSQNTLAGVKELINSNENSFGNINYVVWSDVFSCSNCASVFNYWEATVDKETKQVSSEMVCPNCNAEQNKRKIERVYTTYFDKYTNETVNLAKQVPVVINYSYNKKRYEKELDEFDFKLLELINADNTQVNVPTDKLPSGYNLDQPQRSHGITRVNHFYEERTLFVLSAFLNEVNISFHKKQFLLGSILPKLTKMNRYMPQHGSRALVGPMANVLYFPKMHVENNVLDQFGFQLKKILKALNDYDGNIITNQSSTKLDIRPESIDYIFIDPPFGANIMYSDLNYVRESWLKVKTNYEEEVIENKSQKKDINEYKKLMIECLNEAYRILKPGRWITVEFSNTKASIWNSIQSAIQEAGFIVASVDALDKKRGGLYSMITAVGVKQDLIISAYKPDNETLIKAKDKVTTVSNAIEFIENHLRYLPIFKGSKGGITYLPERDPRILYDRLIAYFVRNGQDIPISSDKFQGLIQKKFPVRDGMVFLPQQVVEYDKKRILIKEFRQMALFVSDENSAIEWLRQQLMIKPQTRQDIHPNFMKEIQHIDKHELLPELNELLEQNFLQYDGIGIVPDQISSYLRKNYKDVRGLENDDSNMKSKAMNRWYVADPNKQADLEKLREKSLLREFESYIEEINKNNKKLKQFRTEAIRAGFKKAWSDKEYQRIVDVGDRLPEKVVQEDDKLLMYYDNAQIRLGL